MRKLSVTQPRHLSCLARIPQPKCAHPDQHTAHLRGRGSPRPCRPRSSFLAGARWPRLRSSPAAARLHGFELGPGRIGGFRGNAGRGFCLRHGPREPCCALAFRSSLSAGALLFSRRLGVGRGFRIVFSLAC